jgi:predicted extracellular nuclease
MSYCFWKPDRRPPTAVAVFTVSLLTGPMASADVPPTDLFFSEYIEGSGNNKALELYNSAAAAIDLAAGSYVVQMYFNGNTTAGLTISLNGTVAPGTVFVLAQSNANADILAQTDQADGAGWFNGDDAIVLRKGGSGGPVVDSIGQIGVDPGSEWGSSLTSTQDNTLRRKAGITTGDPHPSDAFDPATEWEGFPQDTFDGLGSYAGEGGDEGGGDNGASNCNQPYTPIPIIQGNSMTAAITGSVVTQGVVVGDYEGASPALRGFYLQDPTGDGNPNTSDGIFVFNGNNNSVNLGETVRVSGVAGEFQDQTQISSVTTIEVCGAGTVAPTDVTLPLFSANALERYEGMLVRLPQTLYVTEHFQLGRFGQVVMSSSNRLPQPTNIALPGPSAGLVQTENNLNRIIIDDELNNQNPDPIQFGREGNPLSAANTLRGGDTTTGIVGVMTYTWAGNSASGNAYRVRPLKALGGGIPQFQAANDRPHTPPNVGGNLRVASFNLLNYFNTFDGIPDNSDNCVFGFGGSPADCRGADDAAEFERQAAKTVNALLSLNADVIGVMEMENDGYGVDSALQDLVNRLNTATAPGAYAFVSADTATGQLNALGTDAIKVGLIYRPASVTSLGTAVLNTGAFGLFQTVSEGVIGRNRPALAQTFQDVDGGRFTVVVNHFKSKSSACDGNISPVGNDPDLGDGQGHCNLTRTMAASELANWLTSDPTGSGDPDVLIIGDLNAYAQENPVTALKNSGYTNLIETFGGNGVYSYAFDGQWGYLDHALASTSLLTQVSGVGEWRINADEPNVLDYNTNFKSVGQIAALYAPDFYRTSDHDPVIIGLRLASTPAAVPGDINQDGLVDSTDLNLVTAARNTPANGPDDPRDLDDDGVITVLDARKLVLLCTFPRCATTP